MSILISCQVAEAILLELEEMLLNTGIPVCRSSFPSFSLSSEGSLLSTRAFKVGLLVTLHWKAPWGEKVLSGNIPSEAARIISTFF